MRIRTPKIEVKVHYDAVRIFISDILHLQFSRSRFIGLKSWREDQGSKYCVEITCEGGVILCEYDTREKWQTVLDGLAELL